MPSNPASGPDAAWEQLVKAALLGASRASVEIPLTGEAACDALLQQVDRRRPEAALLSAAAIVAQYRRCGQLPRVEPAPPLTPCPADARPRLRPGAARLLQRLLQGAPQPALLTEFLQIMERRGWRAPEELAPALLDVAGKAAVLRPLIATATGARGAWLAAMNPDWAWLLPVERCDWETAGQTERIAWLRHLRGNDPAAARSLVISTWPQEPGETRRALLDEFATGLTGEDEPFLEAALDDRRKEVRQRAAELLLRLPGPALSRRMAARAAELVTVDPLTLRLPQACPPALQRDGVEPKPPTGVGDRQWWLTRILRSTPLAFWDGRRPDQWIAAAAASEWNELLMTVWVAAARRERNADWAGAIINAAARSSAPPGWLEVAGALSPGKLEDGLLRLLNADPMGLANNAAVLRLLHHCRAVWSERLGRAALALLRRHIEASRDSRQPAPLTRLFALLPSSAHMARCLPVSLLPQVRELAGADLPGPARAFVTALLTMLDFRFRMLQEMEP